MCDKTVNDKTINDKSVNGKLINDKPVNDKKVNGKTINNKTANDKLINNKPVNDKPVNDKPVNDKSVNDKTIDDKQINDKPVNDKTVNDKTVNDKSIQPNKRGRKVDESRKYFVIENDNYKCIINNCNKKYSLNTSISALKYHLFSEHGQIQNKKMINYDSMEKGNTISETEVYETLAIAFAINSLPHSLIEEENFKNSLIAIKNSKLTNFSKKKLREIMLIKSENINTNILEKLASDKIPVTFAIDGWTNVRSNKVTNIILISNGIPYFFESIENEDSKNDVVWLVPQLELKIKHLLSLGINLIAITADNESLMKATCNKLKQNFPVLINVPCAAHIIHLCFKNICEIDEIKNMIYTINEIIYTFKNNKENRNELRKLQLNEGIEEPLKIIYYKEIRWTSLICSMQRILLLKKYIVAVINGVKSKIKLIDNFWNKLNSLYEFLKLFEICINQIQKDNATLYSVWTNFNKLIEYYGTKLTDNEFTDNGNLITQIINDKWNKHINIDLIKLTRLLNFENGFTVNYETIKFVEEWGSKYLTEYSIVNKNINDVKQIIYIQMCQLLSKQEQFEDIDHIIKELKRVCENQNIKYSPKYAWGRFSDSHYELSKIAIAILSICPSEAAVERSFSALTDIHTLDRNRLSNDIINAELKLKWNFCLKRLN
jgi:hypothetical protein